MRKLHLKLTAKVVLPMEVSVRMVSIMKLFSRIGMLVPVLALAASTGCSKSESNKETKEEVSIKDVAGKSKETLLVLKFHHDS